jgi:aspartate/methionine/tyrosine aminotransferase
MANENKKCINLGQGVPIYKPPNEIFEELKKEITQLEIQRYSPDHGQSFLREAIALKYNEDYGTNLKFENIVVTPGANQAFINSLLTCYSQKNKVGLFSPYYFNHKMACTLFGYNFVEIPLNNDFSIDYEFTRKCVQDGVKLLVFVNPSNPSGIVHSNEDISCLRDLLEEFSDLRIISDETYEYFTFDGTKHHSILNFNDYYDRVFVISSFSKSFGIPGWRLGYYISSPDNISESIKVQDTTVITAPTVSQYLGSILLKHRKNMISEFKSFTENNFKIAKVKIDEIKWLENIPSTGAYYLFPKMTENRIASKQMAEELIKKYNVAIVPGGEFGSKWKKHWRISFANVEASTLELGLEYLSQYT